MNEQQGRNGFSFDPLSDPVRWEGLVGGVMAAAGAELARRREGVDVAWAVVDWARPALSAAATIALLVSAALAVSWMTTEPMDAEPVISAMVPETFAAWLMAGYQPTVGELVVAVEGATR